jgi:hypothetical protein
LRRVRRPSRKRRRTLIRPELIVRQKARREGPRSSERWKTGPPNSFIFGNRHDGAQAKFLGAISQTVKNSARRFRKQSAPRSSSGVRAAIFPAPRQHRGWSRAPAARNSSVTIAVRRIAAPRVSANSRAPLPVGKRGAAENAGRAARRHSPIPVRPRNAGCDSGPLIVGAGEDVAAAVIPPSATSSNTSSGVPIGVILTARVVLFQPDTGLRHDSRKV